MVILLEFNIIFTPQRAIKEHVLADFLVAHPLSDEMVMFIKDGEPDWKMYFDDPFIDKDNAGVEATPSQSGCGTNLSHQKAESSGIP